MYVDMRFFCDHTLWGSVSSPETYSAAFQSLSMHPGMDSIPSIDAQKDPLSGKIITERPIFARLVRSEQQDQRYSKIERAAFLALDPHQQVKSEGRGILSGLGDLERAQVIEFFSQEMKSSMEGLRGIKSDMERTFQYYVMESYAEIRAKIHKQEENYAEWVRRMKPLSKEIPRFIVVPSSGKGEMKVVCEWNTALTDSMERVCLSCKCSIGRCRDVLDGIDQAYNQFMTSKAVLFTLNEVAGEKDKKKIISILAKAHRGLDSEYQTNYQNFRAALLGVVDYRLGEEAPAGSSAGSSTSFAAQLKSGAK